MKARKKPVTIEFFPALVTAKDGDTGQMPEWLLEAFRKDRFTLGAVWYEDGKVLVESKEGTVSAEKDSSMIMKGVEGEVYLCERGIFEKSYEVLHAKQKA